jgi:hypothetical protein
MEEVVHLLKLLLAWLFVGSTTGLILSMVVVPRVEGVLVGLNLFWVLYLTYLKQGGIRV